MSVESHRASWTGAFHIMDWVTNKRRMDDESWSYDSSTYSSWLSIIIKQHSLGVVDDMLSLWMKNYDEINISSSLG